VILPNAIWSVGDLANVIRDARQTRLMTQSELARRAHVSRPWISQFEKGKIPNPTLDRILRICDILDVRLEAGYGPSFASDKTELPASATALSNSRTSLPFLTNNKAFTNKVAASATAYNKAITKTMKNTFNRFANSGAHSISKELSDSFSAIGQSYQKELQQLKESIAKSTKTSNTISSLPQRALLDVNDATAAKEDQKEDHD
jgi:transcriptional regulator with XRE-family HTH domain